MSEDKVTAAVINDGFSPGDVLGERFKLIERLGSGAMGSVWKALNLATDSVVCLKVLRHKKPTRIMLQRFQQESRALARLKHVHIVKVLAFEPSREGRPYLVTEFVDGKSLHQVITSHGPIPEARALGIFQQLAETLQYAHSQGILHRDVKPENVMLNTTDGSDFIKLVDFGLAHVADPNPDAQKLTQSGLLLGSPSYSSPELHEGKRATVRSDIYAFGCLMYETLTGKCAFTGDTPFDTYQNHLHLDLDELVAEIGNRRLAYVIKRCLAKKPGGRFESMTDLLAEWPSIQKGEVRSAKAGERSRTRGKPFAINRNHRKTLLIGAGATVAVAVTIVLMPFFAPPKIQSKHVSHEYWNAAHELRDDTLGAGRYLRKHCQRLFRKALKAHEIDHLLSDKQLTEAQLAVVSGMQFNDHEYVESTKLAEDFIRRRVKMNHYDMGVIEAIHNIEIGYSMQNTPEKAIPMLETVMFAEHPDFGCIVSSGGILLKLYYQSKQPEKADKLMASLVARDIPPLEYNFLLAEKTRLEKAYKAGDFNNPDLVPDLASPPVPDKHKYWEWHNGALHGPLKEDAPSELENDEL